MVASQNVDSATSDSGILEFQDARSHVTSKPSQEAQWSTQTLPSDWKAEGIR